MDLQMPEFDGVDATIAIRSELPQARIIVLTTYRGDVQVLRALKAGAQAYLLKNSLRKEVRFPPSVRADRLGLRTAKLLSEFKPRSSPRTRRTS